MRLLLDENIPKKLKKDFALHEVYSISERGWNGFKNGMLLQKLLQNDFHALVTFDKNLQHQQNFLKYPITVFVLNARINTYAVLTELSPKILELLDQPLVPGPIEVK
jgi:hypothetical protein